MTRFCLKLIKGLKNYLNRKIQYRKVSKRNRNKIFVIGRNKTGTTSIKKAFDDLGFIVGNQRNAERLQKYYLKTDFNPIIQYCKSAEVFQDYPFSYPETYKFVDKAYPNSKFILTVRDSPEQWYDSISKFHAKLFGKGILPTKSDLENATYVEKGWVWRNFSFFYNPPNLEDIYSKNNLIKTYIDYNKEVINYFKNRPDDLLILNLSDENAYQKFIDFIDIKSPFSDFPWINKTSKIETRK